MLPNVQIKHCSNHIPTAREHRGNALNSFFEDCLILTTKANKMCGRKENHKPVSIINVDVWILIKIFAELSPAVYKDILCLWEWRTGEGRRGKVNPGMPKLFIIVKFRKMSLIYPIKSLLSSQYVQTHPIKFNIHDF